MKIHYSRWISLVALLGLLVQFIVTPVSAAYENTHINTGNQVQDILAIAETQIGYKEGSNNETKFGAWYPMNYNPWCAMFVSWCAEQAGIPTSVIPKHASCDVGMNWFKSNKQWQNSAYHGGSYIPKAGDLIYFGVPGDSNHVGIVRYSSGGYVYTVEGNTGDMVKNKSYALSNSNILGYGIPSYSGSSPSGMCGSSVFWTLSLETGNLVISGTGNMIDWALPDNQAWASYRNRIKSVTVESTVTSVGTNAFAGCFNLTKVTLSSGQTRINAGAFMGCNTLTEITIPANVTCIGNYAFYGCSSLTSASVLNQSLTYESQIFHGTPASFMLGGYRNSTTQTYAAANGHSFRDLAPVETSPVETAPPETDAPETDAPETDAPESPDYLLGDISGDRKIDIDDALLLFQHSMFPDLFPITNTGNLDFTGDGNIDIDDAMHLFQYSMFPDLYPLG